jgi:hypothetical protein
MRIVYVAGFLPPVLPELEKRLSEELKARSVIWIPQHPRSGDFDINRFKSSFYDVVARGATEILLCSFVFRKSEYVVYALKDIVDQGIARSPVILAF